MQTPSHKRQLHNMRTFPNGNWLLPRSHTARSSIDAPENCHRTHTAIQLREICFSANHLTLISFSFLLGQNFGCWNFPGVACDWEHMTCGLLIVQKQKPGRGKGALSWSKQVSVSQTTAGGVWPNLKVLSKFTKQHKKRQTVKEKINCIG